MRIHIIVTKDKIRRLYLFVDPDVEPDAEQEQRLFSILHNYGLDHVLIDTLCQTVWAMTKIPVNYVEWRCTDGWGFVFSTHLPV